MSVEQFKNEIKVRGRPDIYLDVFDGTALVKWAGDIDGYDQLIIKGECAPSLWRLICQMKS